jgi:hemoglobin
MVHKVLFGILALSLAPFSRANTLFEDLGGRDKIAGLSDDLVERMTHDERIRHFFAETDIPRLKGKIADQICHVAGDTTRYRMANIKNAHADFPIHVADFNAVVEDLQLAMDQAGIAFATQNRLLAVLAPMERDIVNK